MTALNEFLRRMLPPEHKGPGEPASQPAEERIEKPAAPIEDDEATPAPIEPASSEPAPSEPALEMRAPVKGEVVESPTLALIEGEEAGQPEMPVEVAQKVVEGPSLAVAVASNVPLPVVPNNSDRLGEITGKALTKMAEILGMTREEMLAMPAVEFERSVAWAKLQLNASEVALRSQIRVDENRLRAGGVDIWPALKARLEQAQAEARRLREGED
jgi:hypothetical protein